MQIGIGIGIPFARGVGFNVASLFSNGELGTWFDPSDMSTLFQDAAGTTPVTAVEQPVSLMLDKSQGLAIGPELVTNGDFSDGTTGWSITGAWANVDGQFVKTGGSTATASQNILTLGKWYTITLDVSAVSGTLIVYAGANIATNFTSTGSKKVYLICAGDTSLYVQCLGVATATIDNISVKEIAGNHAYTPAAASTARPTLSARYNLLTYSEQFDNAAWTKNNATTNANTIISPDGALSGEKLVENTSNTSHYVHQALTPTNATSYTLTCYAKAAERSVLWLGMGFSGGGRLGYNLTLGTVVAGTISTSQGSIIDIGNGWYRCVLTVTTTSSSAGQIQIGCTNADDVSSTVIYTGDGTSGIYIWGADLRVSNDGVNIPDYQRVTTASDYDTVGFPPYLKFDGSNDYMLTNSIDFTGTDKMTVFAGVRKLSDATQGTLVEHGTTTTSVGMFGINAPDSLSGNYSIAGRSTSGSSSISGLLATTFNAPITNIITGIVDYSASAGSEWAMRVNQIDFPQTIGLTQENTGTFGNQIMYIGRRAGTSTPFNGRLGQLIIRGAASTDAEITNTEQWINQRIKAY
jgi:hypothetical protein